MMGTKVYTKQCMYSLKQSHGAVEKKCCLHVFSRKWEGGKVAGLLTRRMTYNFGICDTGMFSLNVMFYDDEDDSSGRVVNVSEGFRMLERTPTRGITGDGVLVPQSGSPICRVVWYKNKHNTENRNII